MNTLKAIFDLGSDKNGTKNRFHQTWGIEKLSIILDNGGFETIFLFRKAAEEFLAIFWEKN